MRLRKALVLILTVSALLLSGASGKLLNPSPRPTPEPNKSPALADHQSAEQVTPIGLPDNSQSAHHADAPNNEEKDASDRATVVIAVFTVVMGLATVAIAIFNCQLVGVTNEMTKATAEAAKFTKLAYIANRPYVTADEFVLKNFSTVNRLPDDAPALTFMVANFKLRNVGKGPAIIHIARAKMKIVPNDPEAWKFLPNPSDDWGDLSDCVSIPLSARVIPADSSILATTGFTPLPTEEEYKAIRMTYDQHIVIYGSLEYIDAAGQKYEAGFGVIYRPKDMLNGEFFSTGPAKYNPLG
jgi:hypothetical protein